MEMSHEMEDKQPASGFLTAIQEKKKLGKNLLRWNIVSHLQPKSSSSIWEVKEMFHDIDHCWKSPQEGSLISFNSLSCTAVSSLRIAGNGTILIVAPLYKDVSLCKMKNEIFIPPAPPPLINSCYGIPRATFTSNLK